MIHQAIVDFVDRHGLARAHLPGFQALFDSIRDDPEGQIRDYLVGHDLDVTLLDEMVESYRTASAIGGRYHNTGSLGTGGMGEVRRVWDDVLDCEVAMKVLLRRHVDSPSHITRFEREWRILASLRHPSIPVVFDQGKLSDGRPWFTMPIIEGDAFEQAVKAAHVELAGRRWEPGTTGWPAILRLLRSHLAICRAIAVAHEAGIVHRDLSGQNIRIGRHDEPYVLDWGVALRSSPSQTGVGSAIAPLDARVLVGNPPYMAPEQVQGDPVDERSDIYQLGVLLYLVLSNRLPYAGPDSNAILQQIRSGPPLLRPGPRPVQTTIDDSDLDGEPAEADDPTIPDDLRQICLRAMSRAPGDRHATVDELADELQGWLEGVRLRAQALALVGKARGRAPQIEAARALAQHHRDESAARLEATRGCEPEEVRWPAWELEQQADQAEQRAMEASVLATQELYAALQLVPTLEEAHAELAQASMVRHRDAEASHRRKEMIRVENSLRRHLEALPMGHPIRRRGDAYIQGNGWLDLATDPDGASVRLYRYVERRRRLRLVFVGDFETPIVEEPLKTGSYLLLIRKPGHATVRYPVVVPRLGHWETPRPIWLPPAEQLSDDEIYIPAGPFHAGGDEAEAYNNHPAIRVWCPGFVMQRDPVTNEEYVAFLDECTEEEANRHVPRPPPESGSTSPLFRRRNGRYVLPRKLRRLPVTNIDWPSAMAYLRWRGRRDGKPWRLPGDLEWEKAARGVDGRIFPWGRHLDPAWCCMFASHDDVPEPAAVDDPRFVKTDLSAYGVRGLGGNVHDWCYDAGGIIDDDGIAVPPIPVTDGEHAIVRGGTWLYGGSSVRSTSRLSKRTFERHPILGFRGVYPLSPATTFRSAS